MIDDQQPRTITIDTAAECPCPTCGQQALKRIMVPGSEDGSTWVCQHCSHAWTLSELKERRHLAT